MSSPVHVPPAKSEKHRCDDRCGCNCKEKHDKKHKCGKKCGCGCVKKQEEKCCCVKDIHRVSINFYSN